MVVVLTGVGKSKVDDFIKHCRDKRDWLTSNCIDSADDTVLPSYNDIVSDIETFAENGEYCNYWAISDNENSDYPLIMVAGRDFVYL